MADSTQKEANSGCILFVLLVIAGLLFDISYDLSRMLDRMPEKTQQKESAK